MKPYLLLLIILIAFVQCKTSKYFHEQNVFSATYVQADNKIMKLVLDSNYSFLYYAPNGFWGREFGYCDTIAYGKWSTGPNNMINLSSPSYLSERLKMSVEESTNDNPDTVDIIINNPIEKYQSSRGALPRAIQYTAAVQTKDRFLYPIENRGPANVLRFYNPARDSLIGLRIIAFFKSNPSDILLTYNYNEGPKAVETETYATKIRTSNQFIVNIPNLTPGFMQFRRLNEDFVQVINRNKLKWDGHVFVRANSENKDISNSKKFAIK